MWQPVDTGRPHQAKRAIPLERLRAYLPQAANGTPGDPAPGRYVRGSASWRRGIRRIGSGFWATTRRDARVLGRTWGTRLDACGTGSCARWGPFPGGRSLRTVETRVLRIVDGARAACVAVGGSSLREQVGSCVNMGDRKPLAGWRMLMERERVELRLKSSGDGWERPQRVGAGEMLSGFRGKSALR